MGRLACVGASFSFASLLLSSLKIRWILGGAACGDDPPRVDQSWHHDTHDTLPPNIGEAGWLWWLR